MFRCIVFLLLIEDLHGIRLKYAEDAVVAVVWFHSMLLRSAVVHFFVVLFAFFWTFCIFCTATPADDTMYRFRFLQSTWTFFFRCWPAFLLICLAAMCCWYWRTGSSFWPHSSMWPCCTSMCLRFSPFAFGWHVAACIIHFISFSDLADPFQYFPFANRVVAWWCLFLFLCVVFALGSCLSRLFVSAGSAVSQKRCKGHDAHPFVIRKLYSKMLDAQNSAGGHELLSKNVCEGI